MDNVRTLLKRVENLERMASTGSQIVRMAASDGGGSAPIVGFEIVSAENCGTCTATATVALNFGTTPDLDSYDQFTVYDYGGCALNEPIDSLVGRFGIAAYGTRVGTGACPGLPDTGWWIISLCGLEDSCV